MKQADSDRRKKELQVLCNKIRGLVEQAEFWQCEQLLCDAMRRYPHDAEPHNLFGILLEKQGDHVTAMRHFRAALDLNPTHFPARCNLELFGTFYSRGNCVYDETDCPEAEYVHSYRIEYNEHGIGRLVKNKKSE